MSRSVALKGRLPAANGAAPSSEIRLATGNPIARWRALENPEDVRIDKWLWAARVFKTRAVALAACRAGHVKLGGHAVKPGRPVRLGEEYVVTTDGPTRTVRVAGITARRVGPKLVSTLLVDLTPPEELARARRSVVEQVLARPKGTGRPTKRDRRLIEKFLP